MNQFKYLIVLFLMLLTNNALKAQNGEDFSAEWKKVEQLEQKGLTKDALAVVVTIFDKAAKTNNQPQQIKAAMYQMKYRNMIEEDNAEKNIFYLDTLINRTKAPAKNILQSMQAEAFAAYRNQNRYKLYDRTELVSERSDDISTWSIGKLNSRIAELYKASLQNEGLLKRTALNELEAIISKGQNSRNLRPTLYDLLAHRALDYFMSDENDVTQPSYHFIINNEAVFAPVKTFIITKFITADTASTYYQAIVLLQDILRFHLNDKNTEALLDADLKRLSFANEHGVFTNKSTLYEQALLTIETNYAGNAMVAKAMFLRAQALYEQGSRYVPITNEANQFDLVKAAAICEAAIKQYPKSDGAIQCNNLLQQIKQPGLQMQTEKINVTDAAFRSLVEYKNAGKLYLRIIKTNRDELNKMEMGGSQSLWPEIVKMQPVRSWQVDLPETKDHQQHRVEIKIDALPIGTYMILASLRPEFDLNSNIITRQVTYVSNISYIYNNKQGLYVLDRSEGTPLANATVQLWQQTYEYSNRRYIKEKKEKFVTDKNGYVKIDLPSNRSNNFLQINYGKDELFTDDSYYSYQYNSFDRKTRQQTFLFTDRSIYRPGQTVFFKGIMVSTDGTGKKSELLTGFKTTVLLMDANGQKAGAIKVTSNAYGSFAGSFSLPSGGLNGQFVIKDSATGSSAFINVEEYKRPKFITEIKKPEGTYRVNDSITIEGTAKAYAGNNIDGAKVRYRVVRRVQYPIWWGYGSYKIWPPYGNQESMEISNGETSTNADGKFSITFKAIPDETVDKKAQPTFYYEVSADVIDINGETRSGQTTVAVAYQSLQLEIVAAEKLVTDSIQNIKINSTNLNDLFEKATVNVSIYALQGPDRMFRERYWEQPDQFIMSKENYYKAFPYDAYADENNKSKWPEGKKVVDRYDTTAANGNWKINEKNIPAGYYKIVATTTDKYGESVKAEKIIYLFSKKQPAAGEPVLVTVDEKQAQPGQQVPYHIYTGFNKIWLIQTLNKAGETSATSYHAISENDPFNNSIAVTEQDRGGINLQYIFVKHNRVYDGNEFISIPWTNKELQITYETFRDKILPGSEEKWKLTIKGSQADKTAAEILVSMYDASLDQFKPHSWQSLQRLWPNNYNRLNWSKPGFIAVQSDANNRFTIDYKHPAPVVYDELMRDGWLDGYYGRVDGYALRGKVSGIEVQAMNAEPVAVTDDAKVYDREVKFTPPRIVKDEEITEDRMETTKSNNNPAVQIRKNFNETAFFFPQLTTDADGNISFNFTIPEALTQWKLMTLAHSKELASGYSEKTVITQKPLMVQPNAPRFLREGDAMELVSKVVNLSDKEITGTIQLELINAITNTPVDGWFKNVFPNQYFTVEAGQSVAVKFPMEVPFNFNSALIYRIKAVSKASPAGGGLEGAFSDGEENLLPILTNRMLVTETLPLNLRGTDQKSFTFEKLLNSSPFPNKPGQAGGGREGASTLTNHALTVEYTSNPAWYAVQALPYLMEFPYECAEQNFNRYYANVLASFVANSTPKIKAVFEKWKTLDTAALMSNLQKNEELKSALLAETPWVLEAQNEQAQKKNIAILFDMVRLGNEKASTLNKLKEMQSSNGGFTWFKGGPDDRYITQYIITGIGHLIKLGALNADDKKALQPIISKALPYLDALLQKEYEDLLKYKVKLTDNHLSYTAIQYLYMRSFFPATAIASSAKKAVDYYKVQASKYWLSQNKYMQAMIALAMNRSNDIKTAKAIIASLKQNAIYKEEMGMYWKDFTSGGYYWYQAPTESQAMMIEAFTDIDGNNKTIDDLKTWLLKQKQTQNWKTTKATAEAVYALLLNGSNWLAEEKTVTITLGDLRITSPSGAEAGTGYFKQTIQGPKVTPAMGKISVSIKLSKAPPPGGGGGSSSWGAIYWQYFEDLDKITSSATPLSLAKKLYVERNSDRGPVLEALKDGATLKVGDKVKVRIELKVDRDMEYIHMKDLRAATMEPVNVLSQYKWQGGLGYYESTKDASTDFFFSWLPRGSYVFEYSMFAGQAGNFSNGITTIQCMYAPEFSSHSEGVRINIE